MKKYLSIQEKISSRHVIVLPLYVNGLPFYLTALFHRANDNLSLSPHFFNSSFASRISDTTSEMCCSVALSFASIY